MILKVIKYSDFPSATIYWCITRKATAEGKVDNKIVVLDVSDKKDIVCIEQIREIQKRCTSPEQLIKIL